jgi:hypothetical protein
LDKGHARCELVMSDIAKMKLMMKTIQAYAFLPKTKKMKNCAKRYSKKRRIK